MPFSVISASYKYPHKAMDEITELYNMDQKFRTSKCLSCCFGGSGTTEESDDQPISMIRSSSTWFKERSHEFPNFGDRYRGLVDRIPWRRRHRASDFRYDPLSYASNFDDGLNFDEFDDVAQADAFRYRNFSSRLPPSPQPQPAVAIA